MESVTLLVNCPTWQPLLLSIGSLHWLSIFIPRWQRNNVQLCAMQCGISRTKNYWILTCSERWGRGLDATTRARQAFASLPFGHGPRGCIGERQVFQVKKNPSNCRPTFGGDATGESCHSGLPEVAVAWGARGWVYHQVKLKKVLVLRKKWKTFIDLLILIWKEK